MVHVTKPQNIDWKLCGFVIAIETDGFISRENLWLSNFLLNGQSSVI